MEVQGSMRLISWTRLCLVLLYSGMVAANSEVHYTVPGQSVLLDVSKSECKVSQSDLIEWKKLDTVRLAKWKDKPTYYNDCNTTVPEDVCKLHENGSLYLQKPMGQNIKYTMTVHDSKGNQKCTKSLTVIVEAMVTTPLVDHNCTSSGAVLHCSTNSSSSLTLSWGTKSQSTEGTSLMKIIKEKKTEVTCVAKNRANQSATTTQTINCGGWDLVLIASIAGGAVALIIFIILVIYSVKYKPWRSHSRVESDLEISVAPASTLQRQLPQHPEQTRQRNNFAEHGSIQKPPTPHRREPQEPTPKGRHGKQKRERPVPPPVPEEVLCQTAPAPPQNRPALPGNHPSELAPKPQPRSNPKPPRHNHKNPH